MSRQSDSYPEAAEPGDQAATADTADTGDTADRRLRARPRMVARRLGLRSNVEVTRDRRRRVLALLPSFFTLLNMMSGFMSILTAITGRPQLAAVLIGISVVLDITDGAVARLVRSVSPFGLQFDSLADLVSFGVAPAILAFTVLSSDDIGDVNLAGWLASFAWLACAAIRLARFNVTIDPTADKRYFTGLPSPGAAGVIIASVFALPLPETPTQRWISLAFLLVPALLMVSSVRYRSFRSLISPKSGKPYGLIAFTIAVAVGLFFVPAITGCALAYGYLANPVLELLPARPGTRG